MVERALGRSGSRKGSQGGEYGYLGNFGGINWGFLGILGNPVLVLPEPHLFGQFSTLKRFISERKFTCAAY